MKIAFTADVHLTKDNHPERWNALEAIMDTCVEQGIEQLVIGGDLFDKDQTHFGEIDKLAEAHAGLQLHIIRGNHDEALKQGAFSAGNIKVYDEADLPDIAGNGVRWGMIPYESSKSMGVVLNALFNENELPKRWVLVGHGDVAGSREINPTEKGVYMPLAQKDITRFKPDLVLLGHIHKQIDDSGLHYVGSPCGLDITEIGRRRFFVIDADSLAVDSIYIGTDIVWQIETLSVVPSDDEAERVTAEAQARIEGWDLPEGAADKVRLRVKVRGYAGDRKAVLDALGDVFAPYALHDGSIDADDLGIANDEERAGIVARVQELLGEAELPDGEEDPDHDDVTQQVLQIVYGGS
jgi:exonuclease SbcD